MKNKKNESITLSHEIFIPYKGVLPAGTIVEKIGDAQILIKLKNKFGKYVSYSVTEKVANHIWWAVVELNDSDTKKTSEQWHKTYHANVKIWEASVFDNYPYKTKELSYDTFRSLLAEASESPNRVKI